MKRLTEILSGSAAVLFQVALTGWMFSLSEINFEFVSMELNYIYLSLLMLAAENAPMVEPLRLRDKMPLSHDTSSVSGFLQEFRKGLLTAVKCAGIVLEAVDMAEFSGQYTCS